MTRPDPNAAWIPHDQRTLEPDGPTAPALADQPMTTGRLEAFSDAVLAIVITVMVLQLKVPKGDGFDALRHTAGGGLLTYLLTFIYIGIYWNNHHHLFQLTGRITGWILWANLHLLFWLSLLPFTTAWMDGTGYASAPLMSYGVNLLAAGLAYVVLQEAIIHSQGRESILRRALGRDAKGKTSLLLYLAGIAATCLPGTATVHAAPIACYVSAAILWLVPDRRIKRVIEQRSVGQ